MIKFIALLILCFALYLGCAEDSVAPDPEEIIEDACTGNNTPIIETIPDTFVALGDTIWLNAVAYDTDQDEIRFYGGCHNVTWAQLHNGELPAFSVDEQSGEFRFRPRSFDTPYRIFAIYVADSCGAVDSTLFTVYVPD